MEKKSYSLVSKQCLPGGCGMALFFLGEMPHPWEIKFSGVPGFLDALHLLQLLPQKEQPRYQMISLTNTLHERFYFQDEKIELILNNESLQLIDRDGELTKENAYKIFKHFLVKKKKRILFLADGPNVKIAASRKDHQEKQGAVLLFAPS
ncbi:hypothetical protein ACF5W4_17590 [Bacillota bacterium Lsc_1132]